MLSGIYIFLVFVTVVILFLLIYIVAASFSSASAVVDGKVILWPVHPRLAAAELIEAAEVDGANEFPVLRRIVLHSLGVTSSLLSGDQLATLDRDGFLALPGLLDPSQVEQLRARFDQLVVEEGDRAGAEVHQGRPLIYGRAPAESR